MFERLRKLLRNTPPAAAADAIADDPVASARCLLADGHNDAARALLERYLAKQTADAHAQALLGWLLFDAGEAVAARAHLERALLIDPAHIEALNAMGALTSDDADPDASIGWFRAVLRHDPGNAAASYNLGQRLFFRGDYAEGFRMLGARHRLHHGRDNPLAPMPAWQGESLAGRSVFVWCDWGGLGDHLLFARYVRRLRACAQPARLILGARPECSRLLAGIEGVDQVSAPGVVPPADVHAPLLDLPLQLGLAQDDAPYLHADPALVELWAQRMRAAGLLGADRLAGLVWRTDQRGSAAAHDRSRIAKSIAADALAPLGQPGMRFVSLQPDADADELAAAPLDLNPPGGRIDDFADTAAIITQLDLVISIDSAVARLAAAMGKPVLLLLRHAGGMFWPRSGTTSTWYPTVHILRQETAGDWRLPVAQAAAMAHASA